MAERNDALFVQRMAPAMFAFADKFFKFVSWAILVGLINLATELNPVWYMRVVQAFATGVFVWTLMLTSVELQVKDIGHLRLSRPGYIVAKTVLFFLGLGLLLFISSPFLLLDEVIKNLLVARPS